MYLGWINFCFITLLLFYIALAFLISFLEFVLLIGTSVFIEESPTAMNRNGEFFS